MTTTMTPLRTATAILLAVSLLGTGTGIVLDRRAAAGQKAIESAAPELQPKDAAVLAKMERPEKEIRQYQFDCVISEVSDDGTEQRLAAPRLITLEGHTAVFFLGTRMAISGERIPTVEPMPRPTPMPLPAPAFIAAAPSKERNSVPPIAEEESPRIRDAQSNEREFIPIGVECHMSVRRCQDGWLLLDCALTKTDEVKPTSEASAIVNQGPQAVPPAVSNSAKATGSVEFAPWAEKDGAEQTRSLMVRGQSLRAVRRIKSGETVTLDLDPEGIGKRTYHIAITPREGGPEWPRTVEASQKAGQVIGDAERSPVTGSSGAARLGPLR